MRKTERTISVRVRESDYDNLLNMMTKNQLNTVTAAMSWAVSVAAKSLELDGNNTTCQAAGRVIPSDCDADQRVAVTET